MQTMAASDNNHILVVGAAGYIGSGLTRRLLDDGYRVRGLDALLYDNFDFIQPLTEHDRFTFVHGDLCDRETVRRSLDGIDSVVFLAALVGDPICRRYPELARRINDVGTRRFIEDLADGRVRRLVFMSTCSNYGLRTDDRPATEDDELSPQSLYAETKVGIERFLLDNTDRFPFAFTILRGATAYGYSPRMRFDLTVNEFTRELAVGNELEVYDADTWRPYCHVDDFATAISTVLNADTAKVGGEVFNLGRPGHNFTKRMLVKSLRRHLSSAVVRFREGSVDPRNYRVAFDRIESVLAWSGHRTVESFIPELIDMIEAGRFADCAERPAFYANHAASLD